jgi:hypothetical protein
MLEMKPLPEWLHRASARRARLQALLFASAAIGTALVMAAPSGPKLPIGLGE